LASPIQQHGTRRAILPGIEKNRRFEIPVADENGEDAEASPVLDDFKVPIQSNL